MTDDTRANAAAQAVPRTLTTDEWRQLRELVDDRPYALHLVNRAEAASLVPAPPVDLGALETALRDSGVPLAKWLPSGAAAHLTTEDYAYLAASIRAAASPTVSERLDAHSAPPSEALRLAWTDQLALIIAKSRFGPGLDMGGKHNPRPSERIAARQFVEDFAAALASDRDASPATPDARQEDQP